MSELGNHLWQSTLFACSVAGACFLSRNNRARVRYWLWLAASVKFLIPFSLLVSLGASLETGARLKAPTAPPALSALQVEQISTSFAPAHVLAVRGFAPAAGGSVWPRVVMAIWIGGIVLFAGRWMRRWGTLHALRKRARPLPLDFPVAVLTTSSAIEPGVFGLLRPVLLLPEGLLHKMTPEQFESILAHELQHVKSCDNLTAALHIAVATVFWFHPVVWWIGRRLIEERERACDEAVLETGTRPEAYAQGILSICKFYAESPLPCASGVTGADLKKRIREIMTRRVACRLTLPRKLTLAAAGLTAMFLPMAIGILRAQTVPPAPAYGYEVASVRRSTPGETASGIRPGAHGGIRAQNLTVMWLLTFAYDAREYQFVGAPGWAQTDRFDVSFTPEKEESAPSPGMSAKEMEGQFNRQRQRMQAVLRDRFGVVLRAENREQPLYALTIAKNGPKLSPPANPGAPPHMSTNRQQLTGSGVYLKMLTDSLSTLLGRYVKNETGLDGPFDFEMKWTTDLTIHLPGKIPRPDEPADANDVGGTSIFAALTEQLGLRLEAKRGPVPVFVVEKIEKPTEN